MRIVLPPWGDTRGAHPSLPQGGGASMRIVPPLGGHEGGSSQPSQGGGAAMRDVCLLESEEMEKDYEYCTADILNYDLLKEFASNNRKHPTEAESILWDYLKRSGVGAPFRRQHIIGNYIADFVCLPARLVIEIDGGYHQLPQQEVNDEVRTKWLNEQGFNVIRFTNEEVIANIESVLQTIKEHL